ncbi:multiubiquitin domain-containing protein [Bradyrhizobium sp. CCGUVB4N]|uniref:multiubiquitin domain-containing protein n=1 Tax=Bradyrhizobium sp. CCGUVB4N TaxID=2949631 RepID=UPI0020B4173F|nr:multiubiquitin domain-containing protein [Bradyrhizobium sp. CCGUVB4N]MCP3385933.1 multiubiquitin domain-containing protein [Bradyrhizobium sp. CCGUVB4N]
MTANNGMEPAPDKVLGELREVRHELAEAVAEEHCAEAKIEAAEKRIEEIEEELARESKIKVNGRTRTVEGRDVSYEEVTKLAFPSGPTKPNTKFTVTFRNAAQVPAMGELDAGQSVKVKPGHNSMNETIFNVTETVLS